MEVWTGPVFESKKMEALSDSEDDGQGILHRYEWKAQGMDGASKLCWTLRQLLSALPLLAFRQSFTFGNSSIVVCCTGLYFGTEVIFHVKKTFSIF